jgi:CheY-like chemotaxis protein
MGPILLVEDNEDLRDIFAEVLRREGYTVLEAGDGQVALQLLQQLDPAPGLVLLDLMMPRVSGLDVLQQVAESQRLSAIPIVVVSASSENLRGTDRPILKKPVEPHSLVEVARRYLPERPGPVDAARQEVVPRPPPRAFAPRLCAGTGEGMVPPRMPLQGLRVLVVEDDIDSLDLVLLSLESKGAVVEGAQSVSEALTSVARRQPDVIVADLELVKGDGCALLPRLRALSSMERVPAVALTGHATSSARAKARQAGFEAFLTKPVSLQELAVVLANLTGRVDVLPDASQRVLLANDQ